MPVIVYHISYSVLTRLSLSFEAIITLLFALALSLPLACLSVACNPLALPLELVSKELETKRVSKARLKPKASLVSKVVLTYLVVQSLADPQSAGIG